MPTFVRMARTFSYDQDNGTRRTIPAGWAGNLEDEVAQRAIDGGFTSEPRPESDGGGADADAATRTGQIVDEAQPTGPASENNDEGDAGDQPQTPERANYDMTREDLDNMARNRGLNPTEYRTKAELVNAINAL